MMEMFQSALRLCLFLIVALIGPISAAAAAQQADAAAAKPAFQGDVFILKGGYSVFSTGLNQLGAQLKQNGVAASVVSYQSWRSVAQTIIDHRQRYGRKPVVLIGHSLGGNNAILIANTLKKKGIQVDLIVSYASTAEMSVPSNVRNVLNFYFKSGGWGGIYKGESDFNGALTNLDMSTQPGMTHFNIDDNQALRDQVVRNVLRYVRPGKSAMAAP